MTLLVIYKQVMRAPEQQLEHLLCSKSALYQETLVVVYVML